MVISSNHKQNLTSLQLGSHLFANNINFWRLKNKQITNKNITTTSKKSNAGTETEAILEISKVPSIQNADVLGIFLTCSSNTSLDKNHHDNKLELPYHIKDGGNHGNRPRGRAFDPSQ